MIRQGGIYIFFLLNLCVGSLVFSQYLVSGKITDGTTGNPLMGATVIITKINDTAVSDPNGNYFFPHVHAGEYQVNVLLIGYNDTSISVNVSGKTETLDFLLTAVPVELEMVVVTATRNEKKVKDIPAAVGIVNREQILYLPSCTADGYLNAITGMTITRHFGIFYKTGNVSMRGLNRNSHILLLIDGIPISIVDGGAVNWNRIKPENIKKIEVIRGPNSSLYGSNAMGGVINVITNHPSEPFRGEAGFSCGTYNTFGGTLNLSANHIKNNKGFYFQLDGFARKSDGYMVMPDSLKDSADIKTYLEEYTSMLRTGYSFNKDNSIEVEYNFTDETRGLGISIYEPDGNYEHIKDHFFQTRYKGAFGKVHISAIAFFKTEHFSNEKESIKSSGTYILYNNDSYSDSKGIWCNATFPVFSKHLLTAGFDNKLGRTRSSDVYHTSTDTIDYRGNMDFYGLFLQDDFPVAGNKIKAIIGIRYDHVSFYNARLSIKEPSATTVYIVPYLRDYSGEKWQAVSPKAGFLFNIRHHLTTYVSVSKGFRASSISDLCLTGDVNKGFKLANPLLKPEHSASAEAGMNWNPFKKLSTEMVIFYSVGKNFQYFVGTGDSIYTTKTKKQPIIKRENIGKAEMYGAEIGINYTYDTDFTLFGNYTYNHSVIKKFNAVDYIAKDLTGKFLIDIPAHQIFCGFIFKNRYANLSITYKYKSSTWADDDNTITVDGYSLFDAKISKTLKNRIKLSVIVENIFNTVYLDSKYFLPPGRFVLADVNVYF